jgi:hypothetical protein
MKIINRIINCEIFWFMLAWFIWMCFYLLLHIFFWVNDINNKLSDIEDKLNEPITVSIE